MNLNASVAAREAPAKATGSIAHATDILISLSNDTHSLTDIARQCHLSKSTTHRVLKLLEYSRLVVEDNISRRYYLGPLLKKLASNPATVHQRLIISAVDEMKRLATLTGETVTLDVFVGTQCIPLYEIASQQDLKVIREVEKNGPQRTGLNTGANVKVLLSQLDENFLGIVLDHIPIPQLTDRTVTDRDLLKAQLNGVRQKGYAVTYGERLVGTMSISAPIKTYFVPAALSVVAPETRLQSRTREVIAEVKLSAGRISASAAAIFGQWQK